jgi:crotonobetainyl-CoA:carnitine CoA-transferase CaiB-like acyl-CoA transferase
MSALRPLHGITVVTLEHAIAAPFCTRQLADLGARVIKIERPGVGDFARAYDTRVKGMSSHFVWTNRSKESLSLDLKHPQALELLHKLLANADVLVQNLAPGAAARLGLAFDALHATFPRLIVCDISGYGDDPQRPGPYRDKKAYDLLIQSEAGFLSVSGSPDAPAKAGCSIADIAAGTTAYSSILAALLQRGRTGEGCRIDVSMLEAMAEWMSFPLYYAYDGAEPPPRAGAAHATIYPYGPFPTGDGKTVMLGLQNEREWQVFCTQVLEQPCRLCRTQRRTTGGAPGGSTDRERQCQLDARPVGAPAVAGARALGSGRLTRRADRRAEAARPARQFRRPHGPGARAGRTHRRLARRTRLRRRRHRRAARVRRHLNPLRSINETPHEDQPP